MSVAGSGIVTVYVLLVTTFVPSLTLAIRVPLFVNEMQHQKDAKDYDKILFLIAEGKGKSRSTKLGGIARENTWNTLEICSRRSVRN